MWIKESNRPKHFLYGMCIGVVFTILCALCVASGLKFKDKQYDNQCDWLDWLSIMLGGMIGQLLQIVIILCLL